MCVCCVVCFRVSYRCACRCCFVLFCLLIVVCICCLLSRFVLCFVCHLCPHVDSLCLFVLVFLRACLVLRSCFLYAFMYFLGRRCCVFSFSLIKWLCVVLCAFSLIKWLCVVLCVLCFHPFCVFQFCCCFRFSFFRFKCTPQASPPWAWDQALAF